MSPPELSIMNGFSHFICTLTRSLPRGCVSVILCLILATTSCRPSKGDAIRSGIDTLDFSSLTTEVSTLVSDSGVTRYKLEASLWYTYDTPEKKWFFPKGFYVEQFDTLLAVKASIKADTAYYFEAKQLWHLQGNVHVMNREGQHFYSPSLFWDQEKEEVYSHDPIRIIKSEGEILEGRYGFKSNQSMTRYTIFSSSGHMEVSESPSSQDSLPSVLPPSSTRSFPKDTVSDQ